MRCEEMVQPRQSRGIMGRGTESFRSGAFRQCSRHAVEGDYLCTVHAARRDLIRRVLIERRRKRMAS